MISSVPMSPVGMALNLFIDRSNETSDGNEQDRCPSMWLLDSDSTVRGVREHQLLGKGPAHTSHHIIQGMGFEYVQWYAIREDMYSNKTRSILYTQDHMVPESSLECKVTSTS